MLLPCFLCFLKFLVCQMEKSKFTKSALPGKKNKQTNNINVHKQQKNKTQKHKPNNKQQKTKKRKWEKESLPANQGVF